MADRSRGILDRLWGRDGRLTPHRLADILLMATLADGQLTEREVDSLSWAMAHRPELAGLDWDWLIQRAGDLAEDAPLFSDVRQRLAGSISDPKDRRLALTLANRVAGTGGPLVEEEEAILRSLAEAFEIGEAEQTELFRPPAPGAPAFTWRRSPYSDPTAPDIAFFDALARTRDGGEARVLIHRLHALRTLWDTRFKSFTLSALGHRVAVDAAHIRFDGVFETEKQTAWVRTLAVGEALFPKERRLLKALLEAPPRATEILVTYSGPLSPADKVLFEDQARLEVVHLKP